MPASCRQERPGRMRPARKESTRSRPRPFGDRSARTLSDNDRTVPDPSSWWDCRDGWKLVFASWINAEPAVREEGSSTDFPDRAVASKESIAHFHQFGYFLW